MDISRRKFLTGLILAPAIVKAENIMKIFVPDEKIIVARGLSFGSEVNMSDDGLVMAVGHPTGTSQGGIYIYDWGDSEWIERNTIEFEESYAHEVGLIERGDTIFSSNMNMKFVKT